MHPHKAQKIDLNAEYPCPSCSYRRRGRLTPIALTEAFGCNRCQQIFVIDESGYVIEQLSTTYPYKRAWRWTGHQWMVAHPVLRERYLPVALSIVVVLVVVALPLALRSPPTPNNVIPWVIVTILLAMLPALLLWLAYRR